MFNSLTGTVTETGNSYVRISTSGVEWEAECSLFTVQELSQQKERVRLFVYLHHREDVMKLYGFSRETERTVFLQLLKVDGIGPRQAVRILSGAPVERFLTIVDAEDVDALVQIPGLGKKTAQKLLLALKGKLSMDSSQTPDEHADIVGALADMGFERRQAAEAVKSVAQQLAGERLLPEEREREIFKQAIVRLS